MFRREPSWLGGGLRWEPSGLHSQRFPARLPCPPPPSCCDRGYLLLRKQGLGSPVQPGRRWRWGIEHPWIHVDSSDSKETASVATFARNFHAFDYFFESFLGLMTIMMVILFKLMIMQPPHHTDTHTQTRNVPDIKAAACW